MQREKFLGCFGDRRDQRFPEVWVYAILCSKVYMQCFPLSWVRRGIPLFGGFRRRVFEIEFLLEGRGD